MYSLARQRLVAHRRRRVARRVLAERDGDVREVIARRAVLVHVAAGRASRSRRRGAGCPNGRVHCQLSASRACACAHGRLVLSARLRARHATAVVHWPVATAIAAWPDDTAPGAAAEADLREERDVAEPDRPGDVDLAVRLHRVRREPVDLRRRRCPRRRAPSRSPGTRATARCRAAPCRTRSARSRRPRRSLIRDLACALVCHWRSPALPFGRRGARGTTRRLRRSRPCRRSARRASPLLRAGRGARAPTRRAAASSTSRSPSSGPTRAARPTPSPPLAARRAGTTLLTMPSVAASAAERSSPKNTSSFALCMPTMRGRRYATPPSGTSPRRTNTWMSFALSAAITRSAASTSIDAAAGRGAVQRDDHRLLAVLDRLHQLLEAGAHHVDRRADRPDRVRRRASCRAAAAAPTGRRRCRSAARRRRSARWRARRGRSCASRNASMSASRT